MILVSVSLNMRTASANGSDYTIEQVNHKIKILYNGYVFINDTIQITGQAPNGFLMGFPYKYGSQVLRCAAYNSSDIFPVSLNVPLNDTMGFYGVRVDFPQGMPAVFTVGFILSNNLVTQISTSNNFTLDFPAYPTFTETAKTVNASIIIEGATRIKGTVPSFTYGTENLPAFTPSPGNVTFSITSNKIQLFDIDELSSQFMVSDTGAIEGTDSYYITSKTTAEISFVEIILPPNASNPSAQDQFGRSLTSSAWADEAAGRYRVDFSVTVESHASSRFTVNYLLPTNYVTQVDPNNFGFAFPLFKNVNYYIDQASLNFVLPEGAKISNFEITLADSVDSITRSVFQESLSISRGGISYLDNVLPSVNILQFEYQYNPLWSSFRPTLIMWALTLMGCVVAVVWKRPKAAAPVAVPTVAVTLHSEDIRSFVDSYDEKRKLVLESESLENMVRKGRIPRSRYKVRKKTVEIRLSTLSRNLSELEEKMRGAGGKYAELMRQLEIAEIEISEAEATIKSIGARHSRGEISLEAYRARLADYQRRKERAETAINGILIRLREEIH
jgi:hypothetical protein